MDWLLGKRKDTQENISDATEKFLVIEKHKELDMRLRSLELEAQVMKRRNEED